MSATYDCYRDLALTRMLDAPPDVVFEAWTDPAYLHWFFNPGFTPEVPTTVDLRVGGQWMQAKEAHLVESQAVLRMAAG